MFDIMHRVGIKAAPFPLEARQISRSSAAIRGPADSAAARRRMSYYRPLAGPTSRGKSGRSPGFSQCRSICEA